MSSPIISSSTPPPPDECPNSPSRAMVLERTEYRTRLNPEWYIVPLLKRAIDAALNTHASVPAAEARAIDVGCGGQPFRSRLESLGYRYTGIDAMQNPAGSVSLIAEIDQPMSEDLAGLGQFDLVFCTEVLEHVLRWEMAFRNLAALLKPGGILLVTCPHFYLPHEEPYDFWRPTSNAVDRFGRLVGLDVVDVQRLGTPWDVLGTFLGFTGIEAVGPSAVAKLAVLPFWIARKATVWLLRREALRQRVRFTGPIYLSTLGVFRKPATPTA